MFTYGCVQSGDDRLLVKSFVGTSLTAGDRSNGFGASSSYFRFEGGTKLVQTGYSGAVYPAGAAEPEIPQTCEATVPRLTAAIGPVATTPEQATRTMIAAAAAGDRRAAGTVSAGAGADFTDPDGADVWTWLREPANVDVRSLTSAPIRCDKAGAAGSRAPFAPWVIM